MTNRHQDQLREQEEQSIRLLSWAAPFVIGLILFLLMLAVYAVRPVLRWMGWL